MKYKNFIVGHLFVGSALLNEALNRGHNVTAELLVEVMGLFLSFLFFVWI